VPFVSEILSVSPGRTGVGTVYREKTRLLGIPSVQEWRIVEHRPPREQVPCVARPGHGFATDDDVRDARLGDAASPRPSSWTAACPGPLGWLHELLVAAVARPQHGRAIAGGKRMLERT
jgi:hypothetical protein